MIEGIPPDIRIIVPVSPSITGAGITCADAALNQLKVTSRGPARNEAGGG
jgi:hypothetical protein